MELLPLMENGLLQVARHGAVTCRGTGDWVVVGEEDDILN